MHAELVQNVLRIGEHVHQMRDRRALIAADIADAAFEQRLGDRQDALAAEFLPRADLQLLHFLREGAFSHDSHGGKPSPLALLEKVSLRSAQGRT